MKYAIGIDYGTESARSVLVDIESGDILANAVAPYAHSVIDETLPIPDEPVHLGRDWALQDPRDYLSALEQTVRAVLAESRARPEDVVGLGLDFTSCTILPVRADGTPLCVLPEWQREPHAWVKLWKHHAAQPQADRINQAARAAGEAWLERYGGMISSEWMLSKALQVLEEAPAIYQAAEYFIEGADWVVWQLSGALARNACCAGYKAIWNKADGFPSNAFLASLDPRLERFYEQKVAGPVVPAGTRAGGLSAEWALRLGLLAGTPVGAGIIDAHSAAIGGGANQTGDLYMIMGTSTCHMLLSDREVLVPGISGVVADGIVPGFFGYEAGQAGVGDIFAWFVEHALPPEYHQQAAAEGVSLHELLTQKAAARKPGESGLLALDWWNGCRTPLVNATLSGVVLGYSLNTRPEDVYRALIEATAYGTRLIIELFEQGGVQVHRLLAGGGLTRNRMLMQIYADVIGMPVQISGSGYASGLGAAILGAAAGGAYPSVEQAARVMTPRAVETFQPIPAHQAVYEQLYGEYRRLVDLFGREDESPLKRLYRIQQRAKG